MLGGEVGLQARVLCTELLGWVGGCRCQAGTVTAGLRNFLALWGHCVAAFGGGSVCSPPATNRRRQLRLPPAAGWDDYQKTGVAKELWDGVV